MKTSPQCNPSCPECHGTGHIPEKVLVDDSYVLTGQTRPCPNATSTLIIQGLTGKRFDVSLKDFSNWWTDINPPSRFDSDQASYFEEFIKLGLPMCEPATLFGPDPKQFLAACGIHGIQPEGVLRIMQMATEPPTPWSASMAPFGWHAFDATSSTYDFTWINGRSRTGRSSLAGIILRQRCIESGLPGAFVSVRRLEPALLSARRTAWGNNEDMTSNEIAATLAKIPHLVLDEWDAASNARSGQEKDSIQPIVSGHIIRILRDRYEARRPTIFTSLISPLSSTGMGVSPLVPAAAEELNGLLETPGALAAITTEPALIASRRLLKAIIQDRPVPPA
jgi:hypothetical protein